MTAMNIISRPVYLQIRDEIIAAILDGDYKAGDMLPSVRSLACKHRINPLTVAKAYQSLQDAGLVAVRRGIGLFVSDGTPERLRTEGRQRFLNEEWPRIRTRIEQLGIDPAELLIKI